MLHFRLVESDLALPPAKIFEPWLPSDSRLRIWFVCTTDFTFVTIMASKRGPDSDSGAHGLKRQKYDAFFAGRLREEQVRSSKSWLESGEASDLTIKCQGKVFKVHKVILMSRSPFFRACLTAGFKVSLSLTALVRTN